MPSHAQLPVLFLMFARNLQYAYGLGGHASKISPSIWKASYLSAVAATRCSTSALALDTLAQLSAKLPVDTWPDSCQHLGTAVELGDTRCRRFSCQAMSRRI